MARHAADLAGVSPDDLGVSADLYTDDVREDTLLLGKGTPTLSRRGHCCFEWAQRMLCGRDLGWERVEC